MACSKVRSGTCSRCGTVGEKHFRRGIESASEGEAQAERRASQAEFFKAKGKYPTKAQQRRLLDA